MIRVALSGEAVAKWARYHHPDFIYPATRFDLWCEAPHFAGVTGVGEDKAEVEFVVKADGTEPINGTSLDLLRWACDRIEAQVEGGRVLFARHRGPIQVSVDGQA